MGSGRREVEMPVQLGQCSKIARFALLALGYASALAALPAAAQTPPDLRSATTFAVLGCSGVTNSNATFVSGNVGACPGAAVTGLAQTAMKLGKIVDDDPVTRTAQRDAAAVYDELSARTCNRQWSAGPLAPGVYCLDAPVALGGTILLDAAGDPDAVWIFKSAGPLVTAAGTNVRIIHGGHAANVYWQITGPVTLGVETTFVGSILSHDRITLERGATLSGRTLALNGAVALDTNIVSMCCNPIAIAPAALPNATAGTFYQQTLTATGGMAPYRFAALPPESLPAGLTLSESGVLSGTPKESGTRTFIVAVTDANGCPGTALYTLVIGPCTTPIEISPPTLPPVAAGSPYCALLTPTAGVAPYRYSLTGTLPLGLELDGLTGEICGLLEPAACSSTFTVTVTDAFGCTGSRTYTLCVPIAITPTDLPDGEVCTPYDATIRGGDGACPYIFEAEGLPPPLTIGRTTGVISGIPEQVGLYPVVITVSASGVDCPSSRIETSVKVTCAATIAPETLPAGVVGQVYPTVLQASGCGDDFEYEKIGGTLPQSLFLNRDGTFGGTIDEEGTFAFKVQASNTKGCVVTHDYTLTTSILCPTITLSPPYLLHAQLLVPYERTITAAGGTPGYTFTITPDPPVPGLTFNPATGVLSGTPTAAGIYELTITATDQDDCAGMQHYNFRVTAGFPLGIPTLSEWALMMMAALLIGVSLLTLRRLS
jgi:hypothetical protein